MRRNLLLAGLLDELADLLKTSDEYKELPTDEINRDRRKIKSLCSKINLHLAEEFQIKTPIGEQRTIQGVAE